MYQLNCSVTKECINITYLILLKGSSQMTRRRILLAVDGSEFAKKAFDCKCKYCKLFLVCFPLFSLIVFQVVQGLMYM